MSEVCQPPAEASGPSSRRAHLVAAGLTLAAAAGGAAFARTTGSLLVGTWSALAASWALLAALHALAAWPRGRRLVPGLVLLLSAAQAGLGLRLLAMPQAVHAEGRDMLAAVLALLIAAFGFLLCSRWLLGRGHGSGTRNLDGQNRDDQDRGGRDHDSRVVGGAAHGLMLASLAAASGSLAAARGMPSIEHGLAVVLQAVLAAWGAEGLLRGVWAGLRPPASRPARTLLATGWLVGELPRSLAASGRHPILGLERALDTELGFRVSGTWFWRALSRAALPLVAAHTLVLLGMSCLVFVGPSEQALIERWGRPLHGDPMGPGLHVKLPWPIDRVRIEDVQRLRHIHLGYEHDRGGTVRLWTRRLYEGERNLLLGGGEELATIAVPVLYRIKDLRAWLYGHAHPEEVLIHLAWREVLGHTARLDLSGFLVSGRGELGRKLNRAIQDQADAEGLGVQVVFAGIEDVHPPVEVAHAFQDVVSAEEEKGAIIRMGSVYREGMLPSARAQANSLVSEAKGDAATRTAVASGEAASFLARRSSFLLAPSSYRTRVYLETLESALSRARKVVVEGQGSRAGEYWLDLRPPGADNDPLGGSPR